jgi:hypothetical protein
MSDCANRPGGLSALSRAPWRTWLRRARAVECGEDSSFEFTVAITPIVLMILLIGFASVVRSAQMPVWSAASECAREAVATETEDIGRQQGERAARDSLIGYYINPDPVDVEILGDWTPESLVTCRVSYDIDVAGIVGFEEMTSGRVPVSAQVSLRVEPHKSRWQ